MKKSLFIIPIIFLLLPFINIHFALLGFVCMMFPIAFLFKTKSRTYCTNYCPRSRMLMKSDKLSRKAIAPKIFANGSLRKFFFFYFIFNMVVILMTTIQVANGNIDPILMVRIAFVIPVGSISQIMPSATYIPWLVHLSYRMYSMILTTVVLGSIFALLYRPRTWCQVCPITSVSNLTLNKKI